MAEQEGITVKKSENFSEWYTQVVEKAELADIRYNVKGFLVHMPWSVRIMKLMAGYLESELEKTGHQPVLFPSVIPESFLKREREHAEFSAEVFWITEGGSNHEKLEEKLALRPTSETAMYTMFSIWVRGWRDLPLKTYQNCQVWRYESYTRPFIRGREFYWIEAHNAFASQKEAENQVKEDMETTENTIHKQYAVPFFFFKRPEHDKFKGAVATFAADTVMPDGRVIQLPSTHFLGQNFSKAFNIKFLDKDGREKHVWQTCYGPAYWRILGALVAIHGDDKGLVLPPKIAPYQIVIVPIYYNEKEKKDVIKFCESLHGGLEKKFRIFFDNREENSPGWKYNFWEMKGVPLRIEVGPRDVKAKQVVIVRRDDRKKATVKESKINQTVESLLEDIQENLKKRAEKFFKENISETKNLGELKKILNEKGGLVKTEWCGEKSCADSLKSRTNGGTVRGTLFGKEEKPKSVCIMCRKKSTQVVYVAKQY